jgi:hypothetical protein
MNPPSLLESLRPEEEQELAFQAVCEVARQAAERGDVLEWGKMLFPDKFTRPFDSMMHGDFVAIQDEAFTNREAPRGRAKTTIKCFLIPIFKALNEPRKFQHYLNVQSTGDKALAVNRSIKQEIELNPFIQVLYGNQMGERWTDGQFVLTNGVIFTAIGAGQSIRGLNYNNVRPDYLIIDDLYDELDINNPESTQQKTAWFWGSLYPARAQHRKTSVHVQGTAINKVDLLEELKSKAEVNSRTFRVVLDWEKKQVLWPELKNWDDVMAEKALMPSVIWFREYQNERRDDTSAIIKHGWLYPEGKPSWEYDPATLKFDRHFLFLDARLGVDPSIGEKMENDYTGIVLIWKCRHADSKTACFYIDAVWNEHLSLDGRVRLLEKIREDQPSERRISRAMIEAIGGFKDFAAEVKRRTALPVKEIDRVRDKISNLENKSRFFETQKVFLNKNIDLRLKDLLVHQLTINKPQHEDMRDALFLALDDDAAGWAWV